MTETDTQALKRTRRDDWDRMAAYWRKYDEGLRSGTAPLTRRLIELAGIRPGNRVLDIASGSGEPGLPAAQIAGPSGFVLLTDQSPAMLAVAREKAGAQGLQNVDFRVSEADQLDLEAESFDAALCRGAIEWFQDPIRCLRVVYEALKPGARFAVSAMGRPEVNRFFTTAVVVLLKHASLPSSGPAAPAFFAYADPDRLRSLLTEAGFREVHVESLEYIAWELPSGREYWNYTRENSLVTSMLAQIPTDQHDGIATEIAAAAGGGDPDGKVELTSQSLLASGVK
jgi:ubiquinone/menaquinone biosynthesis C-methylase UbiE